MLWGLFGSTPPAYFVHPDLSAWFRLWVGIDDGRVRRMEMLAQGHLVDHAYRGFDQPIEIRLPV